MLMRRQAYLIDKRPCQSGSLQKLGNGLISLFKLKEAYIGGRRFVAAKKGQG